MNGIKLNKFASDSQLVYSWHGFETAVVDTPLVAFPTARGRVMGDMAGCCLRLRLIDREPLAGYLLSIFRLSVGR